MSDDFTIDQVQALITRAPFHQWLGLSVVAFADDALEIRAKWRAEWVVNVERGYTHGGIIAALIDVAADWAMLKQNGRPVPTIDLRIDYHRPTIRSDLIARGMVIRGGAQFASAEARVLDVEGRLIASGRGTYFTAAPAPPSSKT
ncbi:MAG: hotdog fold thioesterase [Xanthobacteraceae bacterium]